MMNDKAIWVSQEETCCDSCSYVQWGKVWVISSNFWHVRTQSDFRLNRKVGRTDNNLTLRYYSLSPSTRIIHSVLCKQILSCWFYRLPFKFFSYKYFSKFLPRMIINSENFFFNEKQTFNKENYYWLRFLYI